jgi:hypothetical protein
MNHPEMKRYRSSEWQFALDVPRRWNAFPPVCTNSPNEVIRFASLEEGTHLLIIFRHPHDPKRSLEELVGAVQEDLAKNGFGNFASGRTELGARGALSLDFDRPKDGGTWSCRQYFVAEGTLRYTLGFGTTDRVAMIDLYDRMARSFEIVPD